jgi:tRNA(His) 5'-end guanylyltransferase
MLGQSNFSHKELQGKSCSDIQDMLMLQKNINFNDMPVEFKRGVCCTKTGTGWKLDYNIPIFTQDRNYVESCIISPDIA